MTITAAEVEAGTQRLHVTMRDTPRLGTPAGFADTFRDLDSLLFVSALQTLIEQPPTSAEPNIIVVDTGHRIAGSLAELSVDIYPRDIRRGLEPSQPWPNETQVRNARLIDQALRLSQQIRMERVSYQSPLEILLTFVQNLGGLHWSFLVAGGGGTLLMVANRAIKYWEKISHARTEHAKADQEFINSRKLTAIAQSAEAEARIKEADAALRESEVALRVAANDVIRGKAEMMKVIYAADSAYAPDPSKAAAPLLQKLDQAAESLASIENIKFVEE